MSLTRILLCLILVACAVTIFVSFSHTSRVLVPGHVQGGHTKLDATTMTRLMQFPDAMKSVERSLLSLEQSVHDLAELRNGTRWRKDHRCGPQVPLADGLPAECDPTGEFACCSALGWCGVSAGHCNCQGCINYRARHAKVLPPEPPKDGHEGKRVVVIIPFRDRESHLKLFKKFWRWFTEHGSTPKTVHRWYIYVAEQFDSETFNRGWNFNGALAIASGLTSASPDIKSDMGIDFDCAVIQDIDYLPEKKVDYSDCEVPMQLSSEIDRYNWKTPYLTSAGGIVSMSLKHWRQINGFGNNYFGWGGEDDELHHRLRLNSLLYGDCYPFCGRNDPHEGKPGQSIKRPKKGFGRFSGKFMHSANHTKRITDRTAYDRNIEQLKEIGGNGNRWKTDGLNSLAFSIVDLQEDRTDEERYGITYHHVKMRRGKKPFHVKDVPVAIPPGFCGSLPERWVLRKLGDGAIPWDLDALRQRVADLVGECPQAKTANFLLVDRRQQVAKVFHAEVARMLVVYLRSLGGAEEDALIVADPRPVKEIHEAFQKSHAFADPPTFFCLCSSKWKKGGPKYSVHQGHLCAGGGWDAVEGGLWRAYAAEKPDTKAISFCDNERYWTQLLVNGDSCPEEWAGLKWVYGGTFWVKNGSSYCTGTRKTESEETSFSRLLPKPSCEGDGFQHNISFQPVPAPDPVASVAICIGQDKAKAKISTMDDCDDNFNFVARFAARRAEHAQATDQIFCVVKTEAGDLLRQGNRCSGSGWQFAVPQGTASSPADVAPELSRALRLCVGFKGKEQQARLGVDQQCDELQSLSVDFTAPSLLDIATSATSKPLFTIVEEDVECFGFLCPHVLSGMK